MFLTNKMFDQQNTPMLYFWPICHNFKIDCFVEGACISKSLKGDAFPSKGKSKFQNVPLSHLNPDNDTKLSPGTWDDETLSSRLEHALSLGRLGLLGFGSIRVLGLGPAHAEESWDFSALRIRKVTFRLFDCSTFRIRKVAPPLNVQLSTLSTIG